MPLARQVVIGLEPQRFAHGLEGSVTIACCQTRGREVQRGFRGRFPGPCCLERAERPIGVPLSERNGAFEAPTIQGLRRASLLSDEPYLWYRPTMAALRALKKIASPDGCAKQQWVSAPRCLRINGEDYCP